MNKMNQVPFRVFYPEVKRVAPNPSDEQREFANFLNIGCDKYKTDKEYLYGFCETLFAGMNHGSGQEFPWFQEARCRSMSVGDVVFFPETGNYFVCDSCGWAEITQEEFDAWMAYDRQYGCCGFEFAEFQAEFHGDPAGSM